MSDGLDDRAIPLFEIGDALPRERLDQRVSPGVGQESQCPDREIIVRLLERVAPACRQREDLGRTPSAALSVDPLLAGLDHVVGDQRVEVAAHRRGGQPQPPRQVGRGGRAVLEDGASHPVAGAGVRVMRAVAGATLHYTVTHVFHNAIVVYFPGRYNSPIVASVTQASLTFLGLWRDASPPAESILEFWRGQFPTGQTNRGLELQDQPPVTARTRTEPEGTRPGWRRGDPETRRGRLTRVSAPAVEIDALVKRYGSTRAVDGLSLTVRRGSITAVLGPNAAGKTTTLECCEGLRRPDSGRVTVLGLDPVRDSRALRPRVGVMIQESSGLYPSARPAELLRHLARLHARPLDVDALMDRLGLDAGGRTTIRRLSGGQRQRVALAAALVGRPELVFLDEPTAGLDPHARRATWDLLGDLQHDGVTVVLSTHLIDEAERLADHVVIVDRGRVLTAGPPESLTADADQVVQFDGPPRLALGSLRTALPAGAAVTETAPGRYLVEAPVDPSLLATLTSWCAANGVLAHELSVGRRTLEDVFLELTGRELQP